ncbi:hypothetical protein H5407_18200 [Mitsuaria sp. WAJ17]|uniref:hypothetical protein n=1 Tax=Mitsuaria sp. WAJ17 TaxID=2761452 RepID=UPI001603C849|nr:hypothetical protein [Mitsuaria sp. WAJ17]MBB2487168.1 hypothetical protein [Mitsuaria sp. WAJ17]
MSRPTLRATTANSANAVRTSAPEPGDADADGLLSVLSLEDLQAQAPRRRSGGAMVWALGAAALLCGLWLAWLLWPSSPAREPAPVAPELSIRPAPPAAVVAQDPALGSRPAAIIDAPQDSAVVMAQPDSAALSSLASVPAQPASAGQLAQAMPAGAVGTVAPQESALASQALAPAAPVAAAAVPREARRVGPKEQTKEQKRAAAKAEAARGRTAAGNGKPAAADPDAQLLAAVVQHLDQQQAPHDFNESPDAAPKVSLAQCKGLRGADASQCRAQACAGRWGVDRACPMRNGGKS